jgi:hypothetical protein
MAPRTSRREVSRRLKGARFALIVKRSRISGEGVFAAEPIPWGTKIIEYRGAMISDAEAARRTADGATAIMELGEDRNIDGFDRGNGAALINHRRRSANCCVLREHARVWIIAGIEGVEAGAELTYDYGSDYYPGAGKKRRTLAAYQSCGLAIISQKIASTAPKAGKPKANHSRNRR